MNRLASFPLAGLRVIGPFDMVALYDDDGRFTHAACSCGWKWEGFPDEMRQACEFHNMTHQNVLQIEQLYRKRMVSYDGAMNFLQIVSELNEGRAAELVDSWKLI